MLGLLTDLPLWLHKMAYAIKNLSTIILPRWYSNLNKLELKSCIIPQDVTMWRNSTYNMLEFALKYQEAIDITGNHDMKLRKYEMNEEEWEVACQLCQVLKVCSLPFHSFSPQPVQIFKDAIMHQENITCPWFPSAALACPTRPGS